MKNIAVFASGRGTNFSAIARAVKKGKIKADLTLLVCDNPKALVLSKAKRLGVKTVLVKSQDFGDREKFEEKILSHLIENKIDLVVLAGFMRMLGPVLLGAYKGRILNIHPALLPSFKGSQAIKDAFLYGVRVTGVTIHFVDEKTDHGPIILQQQVKVEEADTLESLERKIHKVEHQLYPQAINLFLEGRVKVQGRKAAVSQ